MEKGGDEIHTFRDQLVSFRLGDSLDQEKLTFWGVGNRLDGVVSRLDDHLDISCADSIALCGEQG